MSAEKKGAAPAAEAEKWFVRDDDGQVFGPADVATLQGWARDARVKPSFSVSRDRENWIPAPLAKWLEMNWLVETDPGTFYGPFARAVVDGLLADGTVAKDVRLYALDDGSAAAERERLTAALADAKQAAADLEARAARQAETTKKTMAFMEQKVAELTAASRAGDQASAAELTAAKSELAAAKEEIYAGRNRLDEAKEAAAKAESARAAAEKKLAVAETEIADLRAQLDALTRLNAVTPAARPATASAAVVPEVVVTNAPPPKAVPRFPGVGKAAGLAALEAAASRELAAAKKQGLRLGGLFGK